jgi:hypothetical protein
MHLFVGQGGVGLRDGLFQLAPARVYSDRSPFLRSVENTRAECCEDSIHVRGLNQPLFHLQMSTNMQCIGGVLQGLSSRQEKKGDRAKRIHESFPF